jgi:hypothetical protein
MKQLSANDQAHYFSSHRDENRMFQHANRQKFKSLSLNAFDSDVLRGRMMPIVLPNPVPLSS